MVAGLPNSFQFMKPQATITGTVPTATQPAIGKMEKRITARPITRQRIDPKISLTGCACG